MQVIFKSLLDPDIPARTPVKADLKSEELAEYCAVAERIGVKNSALIEERLRRFLEDENIHEFDEWQVVSFLNHKLGKDNWHWRGIRQCDVDELPGSWSMTVHNQKIYFSNKVYGDAIPLPVLLTIEKIQNAVPDVYFYVSTAGLPDEDPFLLVTSRGIGSYIVERWDEPDFRER
jgi:hypothetical protein